MKKIMLSALVLSLFACSKDNTETPQANFENLNPVAFPAQNEKVIKSEKTNRIVYNPTTGQNEFEYLTTVQAQNDITPLSVISENKLDIIYPGSILRGTSFLEGKYDPLVLSNDFKPVTLSMTLKGEVNVSESTKPTLSAVRSTMNLLLAKQKNNIDYSFLPAVMDYNSNEITTNESFKKSLNIHVDANVMKGLVKAKFDYEESKNTNYDKKYVMVSFRQFLYNIAIDPKHYSNWVDGTVKPEECGSHEPLYISSVDYGRIGYILVETSQSVEEVKKMMKAAVEVACGYVSANASMDYNNQFKKLMSESKVKIVISGGPLELGNQVNDYASFVKFVQMPTAETLAKTSVPISYKVRRLKDNTEVQVKDLYTYVKKEYKP